MSARTALHDGAGISPRVNPVWERGEDFPVRTEQKMMEYNQGAKWFRSQEVEDRTRKIVSEMTLDEKTELVTGDLNFQYGFYNAAIERLGIPELTMADGPPGVRINNGSVHNGMATALPAPIALAASWNPDLARQFGDVLGHEARASNHNVYLGPAVDIARIANGGRAFESSGEDPLLSSRMSTPEIEAIQAHAVQACLKHYCVNNQEQERSSVDVQVDEQAMREVYLRPFEMVIAQSGIASLMGAFNKINGTFSCEHPLILKNILRGEWGFMGWVMSDYGATHSTVPSALAGMDQEQPAGAYYGGMLKRAVENGDVPMEVLDEMCRRILRPTIGLGVLDRPLAISDMQTDAHRPVARRVAEEGTVLLKNQDDFLPVDPQRVRSVLVVGVDADTVCAAGGGSGKVRPAHEVSVLAGVAARLGSTAKVSFAQGCDPISAADLLPGPQSIPSGFLRVPGTDRAGLRVSLWTNTDFWSDPHSVIEMPQVALNLGFFNYPGFGAASSRYPTIPNDISGRSSVRFEAQLHVPVSGSYQLGLTLLGSARVWVDDKLVLDFRYHGKDRSGGAFGSGLVGLADDDVLSPNLSDAIGFGHATANLSLSETKDIPLAPMFASASGGGDSSGDTDATEVSLQLEARPEGHSLRIDYAADAPQQGDLSGAQIRLWWRTPQDLVPPLLREAVTKAKEADLVIAVVRSYESEHMDRPSLDLPNGQSGMLQALAKANPNLVVVTMAGGPVDMREWEDDVPAILHAWYAGQEQGSALAALIFGDVNPSGKLPMTFPVSQAKTPIQSLRQYPGVDGKVWYDEGINIGYAGYEALGISPRFPFGFGLSYTRFTYRELEVHDRGDLVDLQFTVENTGPRTGAETAQMYAVLTYPTGPRKRLIDFAKVWLEPGESRILTLRVKQSSPERPLDLWVPGTGWQRASGAIGLLIGASVQDIRLTTQLHPH